MSWADTLLAVHCEDQTEKLLSCFGPRTTQFKSLLVFRMLRWCLPGTAGLALIALSWFIKHPTDSWALSLSVSE